MCGISGIVSFDGLSSDDLTNAKKMVSILFHRGPDFNKVTQISSKIILGHNRLSIIDLEQRSNQPMISSSGKTWIVFNGEIYNYKFLREELIKNGRKFNTSSDTEVILQAYECWGLDAFKKFNGMFVIAIYDTTTGKLILARDRVGKKPLYFYFSPKKFIFCSELKGLLQNNIPKEICQDALNYYLTFGYIPSNVSILKNIKKLLPAHIFTLDLTTGKSDLKEYWNIKSSYCSSHSLFHSADDKELENKIEELIDDSVKIRLNSDVPVGCFLSGGIDSSLISYFATKHVASLNTYSIGFKHQMLNELPYAKLVADIIGSNHTEFIVDIDETKEIINELVFAFDEPFADTSMIPTLWVSKLARRHVPVVLTGDGGDELFGGYNNYYFKRYSIVEHSPDIIKKIMNIVSNLLPENTKGKYFLLGLADDKKCSFINTHTIFKPNERKKYLQSKFFHLSSPEDNYKSFMISDNDFVNFALSDFKVYLCDDLLVKVDRASMINSQEARSPLLDYRIVEFSFNELGSNFKRVDKINKYLLKKILRNKLGEKYFQANKYRKHGFGIQNVIQSWFKKGQWLANEYVRLINSIDDNFVSKRAALDLLKNFQMGRTIDGHLSSRKLYILYAYYKWKEKWGMGL